MNHAEPRAQLAARLAVADPGGSAAPEQAWQAARDARRLALDLGAAEPAGQAGAWQCTQLWRLGRYAELVPVALELLDELAALAPALAAERRELLRLLALAACETAAFDVALNAAHELVRSAAALDDADATLGSAFVLGACFDRMGDPWQGLRVLGEAIAAHGPAPASTALLVAHNGAMAMAIGAYHRLAGAAPDDEVAALLRRAREAGERARALLATVPNPVYEVAVLGNLGEVMLHQGETGSAEVLLRRALVLAEARELHAHRWRVRASLADWLLATGRAAEALHEAEHLLAEMGDEAPQQTRIRAHHAAYRAERRLGRPAQALEHFEAVENLERRRATTQLRAQSMLFVTRAEVQRAQWQAEQARAEASQHRERALEASRRAEHDALTGLGNRRLFERRAAELLPAAEAAARPLALALIDVDHFKSINDGHGHAAGDAVLAALAQLLRENTRGGDVLARLGGEEFVVLLPDMPHARAVEVCERLRERIEQRRWPALPAPCTVTASIGLASAPGYDLADLLRRADAALYEAKRGGRNRVSAAPAGTAAG
jgi:diguanylate cyclase (GGDEF)-like protein